MTIAKIKDQLAGLRRRTDADADDPPDPRDARIETLEQALTEEREHAAQLRRNIDEQSFKIEILEKSYSKQLADTRGRAEKAEQELAELKQRLAEFENGDGATARTLSGLREQLEQVTKERDRLRSAPAADTGSPSAAPSAAASPDADAPGQSAESMSIDEILEDSIWAREQERINKERGAAHGREPVDEAPPAEELLSADLVFAAKDDDDT